MKAACIRKYGNSEAVNIEEIPVPTISTEEILVKVYASSVNSGDVRMRKADPWAVRLFFGFTKPKKPVFGLMFSGVVVKTGSNVTTFHVGDEVFGSTGMQFGAHAEYLKISANGLVLQKPANLSHEETASILFGATTAYHFVKQVPVKAGQRMLVYGASGAVGSAIVQLGNALNAEVTAVCSWRHSEAVRKIEATHVIDYTTTDVFATPLPFDFVFDTVDKRTFQQATSLVKNKGTLVLSSADFGKTIRGLFSKTKVITGLTKTTPDDLSHLKALMENGSLVPFIDSVFSLEQIREAHERVETGHKGGSVVVKMVDFPNIKEHQSHG